MAQFDVIIVGGGPAGYVCAIRCAQLGLATAVVESEKLGGVCVNIGCIPTKALLHSALIANIISHDAKDLGIQVGEAKTDYGVAMKRSRRVSEQNSKGVEFLMKKHKVTVIKGRGVLQPGKQVKVGNDVHTATKGVVIATGSRVKGIPPIGLEINKTTVISSDEALFMEQAPKTLAVIGAGAVGMEFADIFNAFGSKVTLISSRDQVLPGEDTDAAKLLEGVFERRGVRVLSRSRANAVERTDDGVLDLRRVKRILAGDEDVDLQVAAEMDDVECRARRDGLAHETLVDVELAVERSDERRDLRLRQSREQVDVVRAARIAPGARAFSISSAPYPIDRSSIAVTPPPSLMASSVVAGTSSTATAKWVSPPADRPVVIAPIEPRPPGRKVHRFGSRSGRKDQPRRPA